MQSSSKVGLGEGGDRGRERELHPPGRERERGREREGGREGREGREGRWMEGKGGREKEEEEEEEVKGGE